jgi:hypothetical protein
MIVSRSDEFTVNLLRLFLLLLFLTSCSDRKAPPPQPCANKVHAKEVSPDGSMEAVVFYRDCPDQGTQSTQVSILHRNQTLPDTNGNIFAIDSVIPIRVAWLTSKQLAIYSFNDLSKASKKEKLGSIAIEFNEAMETDLISPIDSSPAPATSP